MNYLMITCDDESLRALSHDYMMITYDGNHRVHCPMITCGGESQSSLSHDYMWW